MRTGFAAREKFSSSLRFLRRMIQGGNNVPTDAERRAIDQIKHEGIRRAIAERNAAKDEAREIVAAAVSWLTLTPPSGIQRL